MGMSASQARFLGLTARKNNVEYEGQQVNQQRTALSNQSANYYNDLLGMTVPVPPSVDNYTKTVYTFEDGALSNTITSLIPSSKNDGTYSVSYLKEFTDDFAVISASTSIVTRYNDGGTKYNIGATTLRMLGAIDTTEKVGTKINIDGTPYDVKQDENGYYIESTSKVATTVPCTPEEINNIEYYLYDNATDKIVQCFKDDQGFFYKDENDNPVRVDASEDDLIMALWDGSQTNYEDAVTYVSKDADGNYVKEAYENQTTKRYLTDAEVSSITTISSATDDEYLNTLSSDQLRDLKIEEQEYLKLLQNEFGQDSQWMVRYVKDSTTGKYQPYFYNQDNLVSADYNDNGNSLSTIRCYTIGSKKMTEEVKNLQGVRIEQDSTGRYINISFPQYDEAKQVIPGSPYSTFALTTNTCTDQDAYDDAMNQYEYEKYQYDQTINEINAKIKIIQAEDKNLELRLKQLDTEQRAISQEMDSVSNVIQKNIESSFKTFG